VFRPGLVRTRSAASLIGLFAGDSVVTVGVASIGVMPLQLCKTHRTVNHSGGRAPSIRPIIPIPPVSLSALVKIHV
jgi:hypothetical protein